VKGRWLLGMVLGGGLACAQTPARPPSLAPTWREQIAPIVYRNCTGCHHAGGSGPFALSSYAAAKRWGGVMKDVTQSRYMPPWLPAEGFGHFAEVRRLKDADVAAIKAWVLAGMPEGTGREPVAPVYSAGWQMGTPDLVLEMPEAVAVPASGVDLFENFVLPVSLTRTRWVRAMEIQPVGSAAGSAQVVHHANVIVDRTASVRRANPESWQRGVPGMDILVDSGDEFDPDSHFLFWKPDSTALVEPAGMPWRLDPGNDLVLNMHLKPTGKPESVRARIGLYFTDKPATERPMLLQLENDAALDIPAGDANFVIADELKLPVAVKLLGIYPHAHYLGKRLEGWAILPDGARRELILIRDWDIDRQSVYRLAEPLLLPAGSVLHMRYTYDNSAANARNPSTPPVRVKAGNRAVDEMGHLWVQVLPVGGVQALPVGGVQVLPAGGVQGQATSGDPRVALERAWMENRLRKSPKDAIAMYNLAALDAQAGDFAAATALYQRLLERAPDDARTRTSLGSAMVSEGNWDGGRVEFQRAIAADAMYTDAVFDLASVDLQHGMEREAVSLFQGLLRVHPQDRGAMIGLAQVSLAGNDNKAAEGWLLRAIALQDDAEGEQMLAVAYAGEGAMPEALQHLQRWAQLVPQSVESHRALAQVYGQMDRGDEAVREQKLVVTMEPKNADDWNDLGVMEAGVGDKLSARRAFERALELAPGHAAAKANLAKL
jgi:Flp pilus assembly protein TadD